MVPSVQRHPPKSNYSIFFYNGISVKREIIFDITTKYSLLYIYIYIYILLIGPVGRVFANGPGDLRSIPGRIIPKTLKMVLDTSLFDTQQYKVCIKNKVEQSRKRNNALPYTSV